jgi:SAM-dependent methyltransferase
VSAIASQRERLSKLWARARSAPGLLRFELKRWRLARRYLRGQGLEIGALHCPLRVPSGASVRYVDRMDLAALESHYPELAGQKLVAVDVIEDGERLDSQPDGSADFIIANHFIEHAEDPLGALANHLRVLRDGGTIYLAVPDRRRTFDADRQPTTLEHIIRDHHDGHLEEWAQLVEKVPAREVQARAGALNQENYSIHFHVWTPDEFRALLEHARHEEKLPFEIEELQRNGHEFIAILRRTGGESLPSGAGLTHSASPEHE